MGVYIGCVPTLLFIEVVVQYFSKPKIKLKVSFTMRKIAGELSEGLRK